MCVFSSIACLKHVINFTCARFILIAIVIVYTSWILEKYLMITIIEIGVKKTINVIQSDKKQIEKKVF